MALPTNFEYTKDHEWLSEKDGVATVGITDYALEQLGDIVYLELPKVGDSFKAGDSFGTIESTKTVSDLYAPVTGKVVELNAKLSGDDLEQLAKDPYGAGWLVKFKVESKGKDLMSSKDYEKYIQED